MEVVQPNRAGPMPSFTVSPFTSICGMVVFMMFMFSSSRANTNAATATTHGIRRFSFIMNFYHALEPYIMLMFTTYQQAANIIAYIHSCFINLPSEIQSIIIWGLICHQTYMYFRPSRRTKTNKTPDTNVHVNIHNNTVAASVTKSDEAKPAKTTGSFSSFFWSTKSAVNNDETIEKPRIVSKRYFIPSFTINDDRAKALDIILPKISKLPFNRETLIDAIFTAASDDSNQAALDIIATSPMDNIHDFKKVMLTAKIKPNILESQKEEALTQFRAYPLVKDERQLKSFLGLISKSHYLVFYDVKLLTQYLIDVGSLHKLLNKEQLITFLEENEVPDIMELATGLLTQKPGYLNRFFPRTMVKNQDHKARQQQKSSAHPDRDPPTSAQPSHNMKKSSRHERKPHQGDKPAAGNSISKTDSTPLKETQRFEAHRPSHIMKRPTVSVTFNDKIGEPLMFQALLDTGSDDSYISSSIIDKMRSISSVTSYVPPDYPERSVTTLYGTKTEPNLVTTLNFCCQEIDNMKAFTHTCCIISEPNRFTLGLDFIRQHKIDMNQFIHNKKLETTSPENRNWRELLPSSEFHRNSSSSTSLTNFLPLPVDYGSNPIGPDAINFGISDQPNELVEVSDITDQLERTGNAGNAAVNTTHLKNQRLFDLRDKEDDTVFIDAERFTGADQSNKSLPRSLQTKFTGTYKTSSKDPPVNHRIELPPSSKRDNSFHSSRLKRQVSSPENYTGPTPTKGPSQIYKKYKDGSIEMEVSSILSHWKKAKGYLMEVLNSPMTPHALFVHQL